MRVPVAIVFLALGALALPRGAAAQVAGDPEIASIRRAYEHGRYRDVLKRAQTRIDGGSLSEADLLELHQLAGAAAFNLRSFSEADRHFAAILRLNPDYSLDPFTYPPATLAQFEKVRRSLARELETIRQERRFAALQRQEQEKQEEERRRRIEGISSVAGAAPADLSFWANFVPFGVGQFQQGRKTLGIVLAAAEGALAISSIAGFLAHASLWECQAYQIDGVQSPTRQFVASSCGIPPDKVDQARVWRTVKYGAGVGFYLLYAYGVADAIVHHPSPGKQETKPAQKSAPTTSLHMGPGEVGASLNFEF